MMGWREEMGRVEVRREGDGYGLEESGELWNDVDV